MDLKKFTSAMAQIAEEKGISSEKVMEIIEMAIAAAYKKDYGEKGQIIKARINPKTGGVEFWQIKLVVDKNMVFSEEELEKMKERTEKEIINTEETKEIKKTEEVKVKNKPESEEEEKEKKIHFNLEKHIMIDDAKKTNSKIRAGEEHQIKIFANQFLPIGSYLTHKDEVLKELASLNKPESGEGEKTIRVKEKPQNPEESSDKLPEFLRGKHFNHYTELLDYLISIDQNGQ